MVRGAEGFRLRQNKERRSPSRDGTARRAERVILEPEAFLACLERRTLCEKQRHTRGKGLAGTRGRDNGLLRAPSLNIRNSGTAEYLLRIVAFQTGFYLVGGCTQSRGAHARTHAHELVTPTEIVVIMLQKPFVLRAG
jgi:hypothetical protein